MRAEDLQRLELISIDTVTGFPFIGSSRFMAFCISSLARLQKDLLQSMGEEKAKVILLHKIFYTALFIIVFCGEPPNGRQRRFS